MGVSFKVARTGSRYRPRIPSPETVAASGERATSHEAAGEASVPEKSDRKVALLALGDNTADCSVSSANCGSNHVGIEHEASFSLNLFPDGFSFGKPTGGMLLPLLEEVPKLLHPYDRASKTLFSAIECGSLPGDILDDIPSKYFSGSLICEVWDYRKVMSKRGTNDSLGDDFPEVHKVCLRMGMENVVKDMPSISDDLWTYNDLLQAEAQIIKALQPVLSLGPKPSLDRLCQTRVSKQLDLGIYAPRLTRKKHHVVEINFSSTDLSHGRAISGNGCAQTLQSQPCAGFRNGAIRCAPNEISSSMPYKKQSYVGKDVLENALPNASQPNYNSAVGCSFSVLSTAPDQNFRSSCIALNYSNLPGKRSRYVTEPDPKATLKKPKQEPLQLDSCQMSMIQRFQLLEHESQWKMIQLQKQLEAQNMQLLILGDQNCPRLETNGVDMRRPLNLEAQMTSEVYEAGIQHNVGEKRTTHRKKTNKPKVEKLKEGNEVDTRSEEANQQHAPSFIRSPFPQMQWANSLPSVEKYPKKENAPRKRKFSQGPQVLAGTSAHSPVSKLGENQRMSLGAFASTCPNVAVAGLQKDKAALTVTVPIGTTTAIPISSNSLSLDKQLPLHSKMMHKAPHKVASQNMRGTESPETVDTKAPFSLKMSSVGIPSVQTPLGTNDDCDIVERLLMIKKVTERHRLENKKNRFDMSLTRRSLSNCPVQPADHLLMPEDNDECIPLTDKICMSKCLIGGSRNGYKTRILTFLRAKYFFRAKSVPLLLCESRIKLVLFESEELDEQNVVAEVVYGDEEQRIPFGLLPTAHNADLFAADFASLMEHDGYKLVDDRLQPTPACATDPSGNNSLYVGSRGDAEPPCRTQISNPPLKIVAPVGNSASTLDPHRFPPQNILSPARMPNSFLSLTRPQQWEIVSHLNSMQQQRPQDQRFLSPVWNNPSGIINRQTGNEMPSSHLNLLSPHMRESQRQQNQKEAILQSKMANLGAAGSVLRVGGRVSRSNVSHINDNFRQVSGFCHSQSLDGGESNPREVKLGKLRQADRPGMRPNGPLLDQALGNNCITRFPYMNKALPGLPKIPPMNSSTGNYDQKQQHQLGSPQLHGSQFITRMSRTSPVRSQRLNLGSSSQPVNAGVTDICSPHPSSQTVGSGGGITSSPMELHRVCKG